MTRSSTAPDRVAIVGPTATGKSAIALALARSDRRWEIVAVDSMQVYRGMDIGTAKPSTAEQSEVRHHCLDLADPSDDFTVSRFQEAAMAAVADIEARGNKPLLVGGTALYLRAVVDELTIPGQFPDTRAELEAEPDTVALHTRLRLLDPVAAGRMEPTNRRRVVRALEVTVGAGRRFSSYGDGLDQHRPNSWRTVLLTQPAEVTAARIATRYQHQLAAGFVDEVRRLAVLDPPLSRTARQALGYRELLDHLEFGTPLADAVEQAVIRTRRFARRQRSWFRRDPRLIGVPVGDDARAALEAVRIAVES